MKLSEEEKEDITDMVIESRDIEEDLTTVYLKGYADAEEKYRKRIKEQEEAIEKLEHYLQNSVYKKVDSDSFENNWELVNLEIPQAIETVLNILKQNSAELAEKSAEIEKLKEENKKLNKSIDEINKTNYPIINWKEKHNGRNKKRT